MYNEKLYFIYIYIKAYFCKFECNNNQYLQLLIYRQIVRYLKENSQSLDRQKIIAADILRNSKVSPHVIYKNKLLFLLAWSEL